MGIYGYKDGLVNAKAIQLGQKRLVRDTYPWVRSSATAIKTAFDAKGSAAITVGTALEAPRTLKFVNALQATSERRVKIVVNGYDAQGNPIAELFHLSTGATTPTRGSKAFSYVESFTPLGATKGYGTYSTVGLFPTDTFGLTEYCETQSDVLNVILFGGTAGALYKSSPSIVTATTFSKTYQTVNLVGLGAQGSTMSILYRSKFQRKLDA